MNTTNVIHFCETESSSVLQLNFCFISVVDLFVTYFNMKLAVE